MTLIAKSFMGYVNTSCTVHYFRIPKFFMTFKYFYSYASIIEYINFPVHYFLLTNKLKYVCFKYFKTYNL